MQELTSFTYKRLHEGLETEVKPSFVPERSLPGHSVYFYAYSVVITNHSSEPCRLLRRNWIIRSGDGKEERVDGEGVLGKQPVILPGKSFRYASFCPLQSPYGNMRGRYCMWSQNRGMFWVRTPVFFFRPPKGPGLPGTTQMPQQV